ncbi:MAG TPA: NADH-quinone oxidoreductase subunit L [Planctomycetota bacterium]
MLPILEGLLPGLESVSPLGPSAYLWLLAVPLLPLAAWMLQVTIGRFLPRQGDWMPTGAMGLSAVIAIVHLIKVLAHWDADFLLASAQDGYGWRFFFTAEFPAAIAGFKAGILYDNLSAILLAMVALVSFLVHLFSIGYMQGDSRYNIFFSNLPFFTFAMLALVLSDNLLFFFVFWELMGLCSYLLIGHLAQDEKEPRMSAAWAALKAFMTTRVGDVCLFIGMAVFWVNFETLSFHGLYTATADHVAANGWESWMTFGGVMMFLGAVGKSAQFPLHVWLPDAMEGPTPVSAMIHAATMVAAGVYLTGRIYLLCSPEARLVVACVGAFTAIFAATIGITSFDIKKVLAYSTISQLGYMICAIGVGGVAAGLFHVITHAMFKACLFLGSGSVIHGCHHEQDMREMGGLRKKMPITYLTMLVSTLAISGVPLFAGFYSKDAIIGKALERSQESGELIWALPFWILLGAAAITAFYMFRLIFMTFHGTPRSKHAEHAHESPWTMTVPLLVLGFFAVFSGKFWLADPLHAVSGGNDPWFLQLVQDPDLERWESGHVTAAGGLGGHGALAEHHEGEVAHHEHYVGAEAHHEAMIFSVLAAGTGILLAFLFYFWKVLSAARVAASLGGIYRLVLNKYWIDELYQVVVVRGTMKFSDALFWIDRTLVDGLVHAVAGTMRRLAGLSAATDRIVVDGAVNWLGETTIAAGQATRRIQTGRIQQYAYFTFAGALALAAVVLFDLI